MKVKEKVTNYNCHKIAIDFVVKLYVAFLVESKMHITIVHAKLTPYND